MAVNEKQNIRPFASGGNEQKQRIGQENFNMLSWAMTFLLLALLAAVFGFGLVSGVSLAAAKICFFVFLIAAIISAITGRRIRVE